MPSASLAAVPLPTLDVVDSHTAGEPTRVVVGGLGEVPGATLADKQAWLHGTWPQLITAVVGEPRGSAPLHATVPVAPDEPGAGLALLIFSALGALDMCGHALIGTVTTLVQDGLIELDDHAGVTVQTLAGLVRVQVALEEHLSTEGRPLVKSVSFDNAPAWVLARDVEVRVPEVGTVRLDLVYGGLWYAVVDAGQLDLTIDLARVNHLMRTSRQIRDVVNATLADLTGDVGEDAPDFVPQLLWTTGGEGGRGTNLATSTPLGFDRSPCGTGSSARTALLHARGELAHGERFEHRGILGGVFTTEVASVGTGPAGRPSVVPRVTGSAWVTARTRLVQDPRDPFRDGFLVPPVDARD